VTNPNPLEVGGLEEELATVSWRAPWSRDVAETIRRFDAELVREVKPGHPLYDRPARAYASRCDQDDVLFLLGQPPALAVVHLSWSPQERPPWPRMTIYATVAEFVAAMLEHCREYGDNDAP